jgi:hypothetical protein
MSPRFRARIAWSLAAIFLAVSAGGDALHYLPGCGHALELPGGYLFLGLSIDRSSPGGQKPGGLGQPQGTPLPLRDASTCAICDFVAHNPSSATAVTAVPALELLGDLALPARIDVDVAKFLPTQARGPPAA